MRQSVMEQNCLGFIPAIYSVCFFFFVPQYTMETLWFCPVHLKMFPPEIEPMTSCSGMLHSIYYTTATYTYEFATELYLPPPYTLQCHLHCLGSYIILQEYQSIQ